MTIFTNDKLQKCKKEKLISYENVFSFCFLNRINIIGKINIDEHLTNSRNLQMFKDFHVL